MQLIVLGDLHLYRLWPPLTSLFSKRLLGMANLWLRRRGRFVAALLPEVVRRVIELRPGHVILTGDLTTTALPGEFEDAALALDPLLAVIAADDTQRSFPPLCLAVPGNHDRYTLASARGRTMERVLGSLVPADLPSVKPLGGRWSLLAVDSAVPRCLSSRGRIGTEALAMIGRSLASLTAADGVVIVCHYPVWTPDPEGSGRMRWQHRLADAPALCAILAACPARVVFVHGHVHQPWAFEPESTGRARVLDINAGAPTMVSAAYPLGQGFWELTLPDAPATGAIVAAHHSRDAQCDGRWRVRTQSFPPVVAERGR